jgi:CRP-like cAMP-binding protein
MPLQIFDLLLQFPLFLGMSRDDLDQVAAHTKFDFVKAEAGDVLISADDPCVGLSLLLSGTVSVETRSDDGTYVLEEQLSASVILQPEALFGYNQRYTHTFRALTPVALLCLERSEVVRLMEDFLIFRINLLNLLSTQTQKLLHQPWRRCPSVVYIPQVPRRSVS